MTRWAVLAPDVIDEDTQNTIELAAMQERALKMYLFGQELLENACKSLLMLGWGTNEITLCTWPDGKQTLRITTPREYALDPNGDVFEVARKYDCDATTIHVRGRWLDWPMKL